MTARVLVVDDMLANVKLLEARLHAEHFETISAFNGQEALDICARERVDVVLLDVMMPGMDGFEVCQRIKSQPSTQDVPVIMVTALDQPQDKLQGLEAGADDFLTKPVDDIALITRVKNLARLKVLNDEMKLRAQTSGQLGVPDELPDDVGTGQGEARILIVDDQVRSATRLAKALDGPQAYDVVADGVGVKRAIATHAYDLVLVSLGLRHDDGLAICSELRANETSRHLPLIILVDDGDEARLLRGLDLGVNDYLMRPVDRNEMLARVRTQIRRKRHTDHLRHRLADSVALALMDPLTGLHNRRYLETHLEALIARAFEGDSHLSVILVDIDGLKAVNDTYGHQAGDSVLRQFAERLKENTRGVDLTCRHSGEEFVIVMPDTPLETAYQIAERLRGEIAGRPFTGDEGQSINVTTSVGLAILEFDDDSPATLFRRAGNALLAAKREGRNRVMADAA